jgi:DNA-binding transcriptional regulator YhcF (GntR family)
LPPVRALEKQLGLSKNTAQAAYDELVARGLVEAREREGMFVLQPSRVTPPAPVMHVPLPQLVQTWSALAVPAVEMYVPAAHSVCSVHDV